MDPAQQPVADPQQQAPLDAHAVIQQLQGLVMQQHQDMAAQQQALSAQQQQTQSLQQQLQQVLNVFQAQAQQQPPAPQPQLQQPVPSQHVQASSSSVAVSTGSFKLPKPDLYSGKHPTGLTSWLISIQSYLEASGVALNTPEAVRCAASYLKEGALQWYHLQYQTQGNSIPYPTFAAFKHALQSYIQPVDPAHSARNTMDDFRQISSAYHYVTSFNSLLLNLPDMSEADRVHNFIKGLKPQVKLQVSMQAPATLANAQELAIKVDAAVYKGTKAPFSGFRGSNPPASASNGSTPMELGAHTVTGDGERAAIRCYRCNGEGHLARNCTAPPKASGGRGRGRWRPIGRGRGGRGRGYGGYSTQHAPPN
jgi:hypothetical protein